MSEWLKDTTGLSPVDKQLLSVVSCWLSGKIFIRKEPSA